jgi:hypothetical protein
MGGLFSSSIVYITVVCSTVLTVRQPILLLPTVVYLAALLRRTLVLFYIPSAEKNFFLNKIIFPRKLPATKEYGHL